MKRIIYIFLITLISFSSCNYLDIEPVGKVIPHTVSDYRALMTSAYHSMPAYRSALTWTSDEVDELSKNHLDHDAASFNVRWEYNSQLMYEYSYLSIYYCIFYTNEVINNVMTATQDSDQSKEQLIAEAYALRAYCMFDLLNMYAKWYDPLTASTDRGVPICLKADINQPFPVATVDAVYALILSDIESSKKLMQTDKQTDKLLLYRFSKRAVTALEARIRTYRSEWDLALSAAESLITSPTNDLQNLNVAAKMLPFQSASKETILALDKPFRDVGDTYLSGSITGLYSKDDLRAGENPSDGNVWAMKYWKPDGVWAFSMETFQDEFTPNGKNISSKTSSERCSFRYAEMYLIAAEAAAKKTSPDLAKTRKYLGELQTYRFKTGSAPDLSSMDKDQLIQEIANERGREFIMEGHRWFDLRRTTRPSINKTIAGVKYTLAKDDSRYILPFPRSAVAANPELAK